MTATPESCRQRLMREGRPYPRSGCAVCGKFSPRREACDALLNNDALNPATPTRGGHSEHCDFLASSTGNPACTCRPTPAGESGAFNALADDEAERQQYERDKLDPSNCLTTPTAEPRAAAPEVLVLYAEEIAERGPWVSYADFCRLTQPSGAVEGVPLPELPEPAGHSGIPAFSEFYTAEQMREYARAARLARGGSHD